MLANLRDGEDMPHMQPPSAPHPRPSVPRFNEHEGNRLDEGASERPPPPFCLNFGYNQVVLSAVETLAFPPTSGTFIMGADEAMKSDLGLGELASITVANEVESLAYDVSELFRFFRPESFTSLRLAGQPDNGK